MKAIGFYAMIEMGIPVRREFSAAQRDLVAQRIADAVLHVLVELERELPR
jgi:hypothetical protein